MLLKIFFLVWFFLPSGIANSVPVFAARLPWLDRWNYPADGYISAGSRRLLGDHKTIRGFVCGIVAGLAVTVIQFAVMRHWPHLAGTFPQDYVQANPYLLGLLLGAGALLGDSAKSFLKRRVGIAPGKSWFPFDQLDYVLGSIVFTVWYIPLPTGYYLGLLVIGFILHMAAVYVGYLLKIRDRAM
jgi:CDP-2,3-bis-(O-geranylgeranyl)-sn-glycerol synthase